MKEGLALGLKSTWTKVEGPSKEAHNLILSLSLSLGDQKGLSLSPDGLMRWPKGPRPPLTPFNAHMDSYASFFLARQSLIKENKIGGILLSSDWSKW